MKQHLPFRPETEQRRRKRKKTPGNCKAFCVTRKRNKKGKCPDGIKYIQFSAQTNEMKYRFQKKFYRCYFGQPMCFKGIQFCSFGSGNFAKEILLGGEQWTRSSARTPLTSDFKLLTHISNGSRTIVPEKNCPPTLKLTLTLTRTQTLTGGGQFSLEAIARTPSLTDF